jgi:hypothetical protein
MNTSVITSLSPIQSTSYENANSICLANLPTWLDPTRLPCKFLTTWVSQHTWCSGGQHYTLRNSYVEALQHILPNIPDNGTINSWLPLAQNGEQWKTLGTEWIKHQQALTIYQWGFLKVFGVQKGKFVIVMSQGINFVVTSQRIFHFGWLDTIK